MLILTPSIVSLTLANGAHDSHVSQSAANLHTTAHVIIAGQVEMKRVGIPANVPCAVQQWEGLIAGKVVFLVFLPFARWSWRPLLIVQYSWQKPCSLLCCGFKTQGWHAAVNYPARAAGITRHMRRAEAKAKCPELQCVHVETIGEFSLACKCSTDNMACL